MNKMKTLQQMKKQEKLDFFRKPNNEPTDVKWYIVGTDEESGFQREISYEVAKIGWELNKILQAKQSLISLVYSKKDENFANQVKEILKSEQLNEDELYKKLFEVNALKSKYDTRQELLFIDERELMKYNSGSKAYNKAFWDYVNSYDYEEDE